jgi:hypothetical protein
MVNPIGKKIYLHGLLFLAFFLFFSTVAPLGQVVSDTAYSVATAKSLLFRHTFAIEKTWELRYAVPGRGGRYFSKYGLGYALSFLPQIAVSGLLSKVIPFHARYWEQAVVSFTNTFYGAGICLAMFMCMSILGYRKRRAFIAVMCIAAASILLPYSKIIQSETLTAFILMVFLIIVAYDRRISVGTGCILGILCAYLYFIKPINVMFGLVIGLYAAVRLLQKRAALSGIIAFCVTGAMPVVVLFYYNWYRFGSILKFGYEEQQFQFTTPLLSGLAGFFFAPSKSIFIFSPLVIFCIWSFRRFYSKQRRMALCIAGICAVSILIFARWCDWKGGWAWGPRLIVPAILVFHIVMIEFLDRKKLGKTLIPFAAVACISFGIQILGSMVSYQQVHLFQADPFSLKNSQIEVAARLFLHKARGKPERYPCEMFHLDCGAIPYKGEGRLVDGSEISFEEKETFRGFATMWSGLRQNFGWRFCELIPLVLLILSGGCGWRVYRMLPEEKPEIIPKNSGGQVTFN